MDMCIRRFEGRVAMVTGAAGGIGSAIAHRLAREGALVIACDTAASVEDVASEIRADGGLSSALCFDLTESSSCVDAVEQSLVEHGRVDVLVNNAGINRRGDLLTVSDVDWRTTFAVNLDGIYHLSKAVLPHMIARGSGSIVNTASQWGLHTASGHIAYNVSKAAVVAFTQSLARDYAPNGIRVNAVAPGEIRTPMLEAGLAQQGRSVSELDALVPFGRIGRPSEVAALVAFLASDEAEFICGSVVEITGAQAVS